MSIFGESDAFSRFDTSWALDEAEPFWGGMSWEEREGDDLIDMDDSFLALDTRTFDYDARMALTFGMRGEGKSALVTGLSLKFRHDSWVQSDHYEISPIVTNMMIYDTGSRPEDRVIRLPSLHRVYGDEDNNEIVRDAIIVWDEIGETVNSKRPSTKAAVSFDHAIQMARKTNSELLTTTQHPATLTGMFMRQCDWFIRPAMRKWGWWDPKTGERYTRASIKFSIWNWNGSVTGVPARRKYIEDLPRPMRVVTIYGAECLFDLYDTTYIVPSNVTEAGKVRNEEADKYDNLRRLVFGGDVKAGIPPAVKLSPEQLCARLDVFCAMATGKWTAEWLEYIRDAWGFVVDGRGVYVAS